MYPLIVYNYCIGLCGLWLYLILGGGVFSQHL